MSMTLLLMTMELFDYADYHEKGYFNHANEFTNDTETNTSGSDCELKDIMNVCM